jgi:single-stranded DNA-binding protein
VTIHALISGVLWKDPEQRTSKSTGKMFTTATIRIKDGDEVQWIKLLAFGTDTQAELIRLADGDAVSVSGCYRRKSISHPIGGEDKHNNFRRPGPGSSPAAEGEEGEGARPRASPAASNARHAMRALR